MKHDLVFFAIAAGEYTQFVLPYACAALAGRRGAACEVMSDGVSNEEKNAALKASAVALARKSFPELEKLDDATLYAAIDLSYRLLKDIGIKESVEVPS